MNLNRDEIRSAIIGMVIGDASLSKRWKTGNAHLQMTHSEKQYEYMLWKKTILDKITGSSICPTTRELKGKIYKGYHLGTHVHPMFTKLYKRFYHETHKCVDEYLVKKITPLALAIMYMDDGTFGNGGRKSDSFFLCTQSFDYANQLLLKKSMKIKYDLDWNLNKTAKSVKGTYNYRLRLANKCNQRFLEIIRPYVELVPCMVQKLGSDANQGSKPCDIV